MEKNCGLSIVILKKKKHYKKYIFRNENKFVL